MQQNTVKEIDIHKIILYYFGECVSLGVQQET